MILRTKNYLKESLLLSIKDQVLLLEQEKRLEIDIFDIHLHTKKLKGFGDNKVFSFRITRAYRGIFRLSDQDIILFSIGHRKDICQSL